MVTMVTILAVQSNPVDDTQITYIVVCGTPFIMDWT